MVEWVMNDELEKMWNKSVLNFYEVLPLELDEGTEKIQETFPSVFRPRFELGTSWIQIRIVTANAYKLYISM
jgi:hypothetical protein